MNQQMASLMQDSEMTLTIPKMACWRKYKRMDSGTKIQCPEEWSKFSDVRPDFDIITKNNKLKEIYTKFLEEQLKYKTWEEISGR